MDRENAGLIALCLTIAVPFGAAAWLVYRQAAVPPGQAPVTAPAPAPAPAPPGVQGWAQGWQAQIDQLTKRIENDPDSAGSYTARANVYQAIGDFESALADLDTAIALDPRNRRALLARASLHEQMGEYAAMAADATGLIELDPSDANYALRARARREREDRAGALEDYTRAVELSGGSPAYLEMRAGLLVEAGDWAAAILDYDALIRESDDPRQRIARGQCRVRMRAFDGAEADFDLAMKRVPPNIDALEGRAAARRGRGDAEAALEDADKAVACQQFGETRGWGVRAAVLTDLGRFEEALADLETAMRVDRDNPHLRYQRGWTHWAAGRVEAAAADFEAALAHGDAGARLALGIVRYHQGRWSEAREHLGRAARTPGHLGACAAMYRYLAGARGGEEPEARAELQEYAERRGLGTDGDWADRLIAFLLDRLREAELLSSAGSVEVPGPTPPPIRLGEAFFFAGSRRLLAGDPEGARERFTRCVEAGQVQFFEYQGARIELR